VNSGPSPSTLREMRRHFSNPITLFVLGAVVAVLTLVGPFGTDQSLTPGFRALYWLAIVGATYVVGFGIDGTLRARMPEQMARIVIPLAMGLAITGVVIGVNYLLIGRVPGGRGWLGDTVTIYAIAVIVSAAMQAVMTAMAKTDATDTPRTPPILDRVPLDKRGALVALSVEDHYVRVRTSRGEEMILMRLSDAIRETAPETGLRVHRSHWVAVAQVTSARRDGDRAVLTMAHGGDIPVSRSHIPAVREAGLLPR
jgi:hypothetical protein